MQAELSACALADLRQLSWSWNGWASRYRSPRRPSRCEAVNGSLPLQTKQCLSWPRYTLPLMTLHIPCLQLADQSCCSSYQGPQYPHRAARSS